MTPAINLLKKNKQPHRIHKYTHDPNSGSYGLEASEKLGVAPEQVFKTLVVEMDNGKLAVCILPVTGQLQLKAAAKGLGCKKVEMADPARVQKSTGYVLGGVSPLGQKTRLKTVLDQSAKDFETIFVSAGRRGLEIEIAPTILIENLAAATAEIVG